MTCTAINMPETVRERRRPENEAGKSWIQLCPGAKMCK